MTRIVMIVLDDWGWGSAGFRGHSDILTPNIDALVSSGREFQHFCAVAPVCSPARAGYWTGRHPQFSGVHYTDGPSSPNRYHVPNGMPTFASLLQAADIPTAHFGKTNLGYPPRCNYPTSFGYDFWAGGITFPDLGNFLWLPNGVSAGFTRSNVAGVATDTVFHQAARDWITDQASGDFFCSIWGNLPHEDLTSVTLSEMSLAAYSSATAQEKRHWGAISHVDTQVGLLVSHLTTLGILDSTWILITSDQGPEPNNGGSTGGLRGYKTHLTEGGLRVPCVLYGPDVSASTDTTPRDGLDILPTFLDIAGVSIPAWATGTSLLDAPGTRTLYAEYHRAQRSPVEGGIAIAKSSAGLKCHKMGEASYELYDLTTDAAEATDIYNAGNSAHTDLSTALETWLSTLPVEGATAGPFDDEAEDFLPPEPTHIRRIADGDISALLDKLLGLPKSGGLCSHGNNAAAESDFGTESDTHATLGHTGTVVMPGIFTAAQDPTNRARLTSGELDTLDAALEAAVAQPPAHTTLP